MRSELPKRVWNKCMEYKITKVNGDVVWNKLVGGNVNPKEVSYFGINIIIGSGNNVHKYNIYICSWRKPDNTGTRAY